MGGKPKQNQRTKNNAQPSNSGRSAELLGASVPPFVGFSAHADLGMVPFAPGFATTENLPETFDSSISSQFQLVLRKMSKKDPTTKVRALQEFIDLLKESEVDVVKGILPLWPKFYHNLANDVDHRVRESAQNVQDLIVSKCKKAVAPYLKQLAPVWLGSQFDNYPPAASVAAASFQSLFTSNKIQEVCLFCQQEILDYVVRNLTFHTASTLTSAKSCTPEEAEHKYQRVVACSLKLLSFFVEQTAGSDISLSIEKIHNLLSHQKFWSFSKNRVTYIKSAWFELVYNVLQYMPQLTKDIKGQLIPTCFQNLDDSDPLIVPHVWGCILLLQNAYEDWYTGINFKKNVQSKLSAFLRNACNGNAEAVCPNLLPFLSKLTPESLQGVPLDEFYRDFFNDMKEAITSDKTISKSDYSSFTAAYYECIRFILQQLNKNNENEPSQLSQYILDEFINYLVKWACSNGGIAAKYIFIHTSALVAYWDDHSDSKLYSQFLEGFWLAIMKDIETKAFHAQYLNNVIDLINNLFLASPNLQSHKVKFSKNVDEDATDEAGLYKIKPKPSFVQTDLRKLVVLLVRLCLNNVSEPNTLQYETQMRILTKLYGDAQFYGEISSDLETTLNLFADLLRDASSEPSEIVAEIVFEILNYMEKNKKLQFINELLQIKNPALQQCVLQRLLSYPMCVEPEVREILAQDHVVEIILQTANEVLLDDSKEKFNLLHKCFFQMDSGKTLINQKTVDGIVDIISKPLINPEEYVSMMDPCGSFIAQVMTVVCSFNSSEKAQKDIFITLFQFTINQKKSDDLSEDTLWEVTTSWQDALSSGDIVMDEQLLQECSEIISNRLSKEITTDEIDIASDIVAKLIMCSTENIENEEKRYERIDSYLEIIFKPANEDFNKVYKKVANFCTFLEVIKSAVAVTELPDDAGKDINYDMFFRRSLLNLTTEMYLGCRLKPERFLVNLENKADDEERTEVTFEINRNQLDKWTDKMYDLTVELIKIGAISTSLATNRPKTPKNPMECMLKIAENITVLLRHLEDEHVLQIKDRLLKDAAFNDLTAVRATPFLMLIPPYAQFEESALILIHEDLTEYFITREAISSYVNMLQFILDQLTTRVVSSDNPILARDGDVWQKCAIYRCLIRNNFKGDTNEIADKQIIAQTLNYITEVSESQQNTDKEKLLYNTDVTTQDFLTVSRVVEYMNLLTEVLARFPYELTIKNWDIIRLGLSSWVLSVSKSVENHTNVKVPIFVVAVYRLHATLAAFIKIEKTKSSTVALTNMIDEWENLFSPEVNLVLFKSFYNFVSLNETAAYFTSYARVITGITSSIRRMDFGIIYKSWKCGKKINLNDLTNFFLDSISSPVFSLRLTSVHALTQLSQYFIETDKEQLEKTTDIVDTKARENSSLANWHFMSRFKKHLEKYEAAILKYLDEFSFKMTELPELKPIDKADAYSYLFVWEIILHVCAMAPVELRSVYTSWLTENKFDQKFLNFLFRAMPVEILKNHDSKLMSNELFKGIDWKQFEKENIPIDKYVCYLYAEALSKLPAVVRKWWNGSHSRQKVFVDKLTTNFVSGLICQDELETIGDIMLKHDNMQVTVHTSTREVNAVYFIDEARMELIITLAPNYPLGGVKVESGKQIGGRASSRNIAMQLTIFLTHQNGSIFDGLSLWKKNLDKKFEGVEECYVCYTVIHQDTCQLPKLTCKTCRKKFHSPCLYKWFTTSSKSTCPICRNIF